MTATAPVFTFDEAVHEYRVDGRVLPSITQVIEAAGLVDYSQFPADDLAFYQNRGTALHRSAWYDDEGDLDQQTVDPLVAPRLEAWRKFRKDLPFSIICNEAPKFDRTYGYAGTPDRLVSFPNGSRAVIELKSGPIQPAAAIQTAAQANLFHPGSPERLRRFAIHLRGDGSYAVKEFCQSTARQDLSTFLCALNLMAWKGRNL